MTQTTKNPNASSDMQQIPATSERTRCTHRTRRGSRCRLRVSDAATGLCFRHSHIRDTQIDGGDLSNELLEDLHEFESPEEVHTFLSRLLGLLAQNRVSTRRAAVFCYICAQLLRTFREIDRNPPEQKIIIDIDSAVARRAAGLIPPDPPPPPAPAQAHAHA
jgi:hypothetical protein